MVLRTDIYDLLWDDGTTVEFDQNLNACILQLRSALGDDVVDHYVRTAEWEQSEYDRKVTDFEVHRGFEQY